MNKKKLLVIVAVVIAIGTILMLYNPGKFGVITDQGNQTNGASQITLTWNPELILGYFVLFMVIGIILYYVIQFVSAVIAGKGKKTLFGFLFKKDEISKEVPQNERIRKAWAFTIKWITNQLHIKDEDIPKDMLNSSMIGDRHLQIMEIAPSPKRKDATVWELYIFRLGNTSFTRKTPNMTDSKPHQLWYLLMDCNTGDCYPKAIREYGEGGKLLNNLWLGGWQKLEESGFDKIMKQAMAQGAGIEIGKEMLSEKSENKNKEEKNE